MKKVLLFVVIAISFVGNGQVLGTEDYTPRTRSLAYNVGTYNKSTLSPGEMEYRYLTKRSAKKARAMLVELSRIVKLNGARIEMDIDRVIFTYDIANVDIHELFDLGNGYVVSLDMYSGKGQNYAQFQIFKAKL